MAYVLASASGCVVRLAEAVDHKMDVDKLLEQTKASQQQCKDDMRASTLDPIRSKIELNRAMGDKDPPPFSIVSNDAFPVDSERPIIAQWASMRDECIKRVHALRATAAGSGSPTTRMQFAKQMSISNEISAHVSEMIVDLYQQRMTYAEFAQKQYDFGRDAQAAETAYTQAVIERDDDRQAQTYDQFVNTTEKNWTTYIQSVNARQPNARDRTSNNEADKTVK